eukprot:TRINITY_DN2840_c0_g1_i2.p1 TRINITY_DN2840_c0_g1~~TRINITY_DN2840_c0_g1_i2.p1  ORF type:complete len:840 (+),score=224.56 TRINITY_DN2840_c0_g1_i2:59-2521(+)
MWKGVAVFLFTFYLIIGLCVAVKCTADNKIHVTEHVLDRDVKQIEWISPTESNSVEAIFVLTTSGTVYRSVDEGKSLSSQHIGGKIMKIVPTNATKQVLFLGSHGDIWKTNDQGETYKSRAVSFNPNALYPHPTDPNWILATGKTPKCGNYSASGACSTVLYITKDFAESWQFVKDYVGTVSWGGAGLNGVPKENIILTTWETPGTVNQNELKYYDSVFQRSRDAFVHLPDYSREHIIAVLYHGDVIFLAKPTSADSNSDLELWVSVDHGDSFARAEFPTTEDLKENRYTLIDISEGAAFINVDHSDENWGTTYGSGGLDRRFVETLKYTRRNRAGRVDFKRIRGLHGIYIANELLIDPDSNLNDDTHGRTVISLSKGAEWQKLAAPKTDPFGNNLNCALPNCSLHLFGATQSEFGQFYSSHNAPGLIIATGSIGPYLLNIRDEVNTYFSRDAGLTWFEIAKGDYVYEFGDHGGLIILANNNEDTKEIKYSFNEGLDWITCEFTDQNVDITNILTDPVSTAKNFLIQGKRIVNNNVQSLLIHVDFESYLTRECVDSDYELWSPSDARGGGCLLGQKYVYERRKRDSACFNPRDLDRQISVSSCNCSAADYECDFCFVKNPKTNTCEFFCNDHQILLEPEDCKDYWYQTQGYRRIPEDKCLLTQEAVDKFEPKRVKCGSTPYTTGTPSSPGKSGMSGGGVFLLVVLLLLFVVVMGVAGLIVAARMKPEVREVLNSYAPALAPLWDPRTGFRNTGSTSSSSDGATNYQLLGRGSNSLLDDEEDDDDLVDAPEEFDDKKLGDVEKNSGKNLSDDDDDFNPRNS